MIHLISTSIIKIFNFQVYKPGSKLSPWIQCMWSTNYNSIESRDRAKFHPDGGASLTITLSQLGPQIEVELNKSTISRDINSASTVIGLRFNPGGIDALLPIEALASAGQPLLLGEDLTPTWHPSLRRVIDSMPVDNTSKCIDIIQIWLLDHMEFDHAAHNSGMRLVHAVQQGKSPIKDIASELGMTRRTLERRLKANVGFSPQQLFDINRIQQARNLMCRSKLSLSGIAMHCGFFDQAHFSHAFKKITRETPLLYRNRKLSQNYNPEPGTKHKLSLSAEH